MYYYKNGGTYVASLIEIPSAKEISKTEYDRVKSIVGNRPTAPDGYGYRLTESLEWEQYELPAVEESDEITEAEALEILLGGAVE